MNEEFLNRLADDAMILGDLDAAIIGYDVEDLVPVYSFDGLIEGLLRNNPEWDADGAMEWYDYNIASMLAGNHFRVVHMELAQ